MASANSKDTEGIGRYSTVADVRIYVQKHNTIWKWLYMEINYMNIADIQYLHNYI